MNLYDVDKTGNLTLNLHRGQAQAWQSQRRFIAVLAGTQGGKTSYGPWWLYKEIYGWDAQPGLGAGDYLAVTASYDLFKLKMLPELKAVFVDLLGMARYWAGDKVLELKNPETGEFEASRSDDPMWGRIILRSAAADGGLESSTAKAAWIDEAGMDEFTVEIWEAVQRRLSLNQGRVLFTTTVYNLGWLKTEIYDSWVDGDRDIEIVQFASTMNPAFPKAEYERQKKKMPTWRFEMFYDGKFTKPAGLIYHDFEDTMLVDPFSIPNEWRRVVGVDFGGANTSFLWLAEDPKTAIWYAYDSTLDGYKTTNEHADEAKSKAAGLEQVIAVGGAPSEIQPRADFGAAGFHIFAPTVKDVESGIDRVTSLIKTGHFRLFRTLTGVRDELGTYRRKLDTTGEATETIMDKRTFHRLDCLRYAATYINSGAGWLVHGIQ